MKKQLIITLALCACALGVWGNVVTGVAAIPDGYYNGVSGLSSSEAILDALFAKIKGHTVIGYNGLEPYYEYTDLYSDTIWDIYSTCNFSMDDANCSQKAVCDCWNKEHSIPQSWFNEGTPMKSDLFHVYPTDARVNNFRSNLPYGEVSGTNGAGFPDNKGGHGLGKKGSNTFPGYSGTVFEPADAYKGDLARTYFYMVARYRDKNLNSSEGVNVFTANKTNLTEFAKNLFLKWHRNDPVSEKEIDRNQAVYGIQKNRNPFIDYPDLVEYIWGDLVGQTVDLSSMTPTCEGGGSTPIVVIKHGVTWTVNGEELSVDSIKENKKPELLPESPTSCSSESSEFVGWTNTPISGISNNAPAVLYTKAADFPAVTADVTYYAVFAHAETEQLGIVAKDETINFSSKGFSNGEAITTVEQGDVTVTFAKGTASTNIPKYYNTGTAVRCYPGNTMTVAAQNITQIEISYGSGDNNNAITANTGTFNGSKWTGTANSVTFSVGGSSDHRRIMALKVTMNGQGSVTTYNRYITSCQTATEIINTSVDEQAAKKILIGGQMYILVGEQLFTITGQKVR